MTPDGVELPPEDQGLDLARGPLNQQPEIGNHLEGSEVLGNPEEPEENIVAEITAQDLGDLDASPGLDTYRAFGRENPADRLFELSSTLRARGQFQRALLAFERIIDTAEADATALGEAAQGISTLAPTLPRWIIDPTQESALILHLGTAQEAPDEIKAALLEVATLIRDSSSDQLEITPKIITNGRSEVLPDSPITLWMSIPDKKDLSTPVMSLRISEQTEQAIDDIALAVFQTVRSHLSNHATLNYPSPPELQAPGRTLLTTHITRLMWRDFAQSLKEPPSVEPESESDAAASPN